MGKSQFNNNRSIRSFSFVATHLILLALSFFWSSCISATSSPPPPTMTVLIAEQLAGEAFVVHGGPSSYSFSGTVEWPGGATPFSSGTDIYFGMLSPDRESVWTFAEDE